MKAFQVEYKTPHSPFPQYQYIVAENPSSATDKVKSMDPAANVTAMQELVNFDEDFNTERI